MEKRIAFALLAFCLLCAPLFAQSADALGGYWASKEDYNSAKKLFDRSPGFDSAKALLLKSIDRVLAYSDLTLDSISSSSFLSPEAKSAFSNSINERKSSLEGLRLQADSATATEELRPLLREAKMQMGELLPLLKKRNILNSFSRQEAAIEKLSVGADRIEQRISSLEVRGADASSARESLSELRSSIASAKTYSEAAKADLSSIDSSNFEARLSSAESQFRACRKEMLNAVSLMKTALLEIRKSGGSFEGSPQNPRFAYASQFKK